VYDGRALALAFARDVAVRGLRGLALGVLLAAWAWAVGSPLAQLAAAFLAP